MPLLYLRRLTGRDRHEQANRHLACVLSFIAGATNCGGYLAVRHYTSHMSGTTASIANSLAVGQTTLALAGASALVAFVSGAACTAILVNWARRRRLQSEYALALLLEAVLLTTFCLFGPHLVQPRWAFLSFAVGLLCFTMGLQNAIITKISRAEIRTTHVTGLVTDIGIELGRLLYWNRSPHLAGRHAVRADRDKLALLTTLFVLFVGGGVTGALAFRRVGFLFLLPAAFVLVVLAFLPILDDLRSRAPQDAA